MVAAESDVEEDPEAILSELPSIGAIQDAKKALEIIDTLHTTTLRLRDGLVEVLQDGDEPKETDGDTLRDKFAEIQARLAEKRPGRWRRDNKELLTLRQQNGNNGLAIESPRMVSPLSQLPSIADLEAELEALSTNRSSRERRQEDARDVTASPSNNSPASNALPTPTSLRPTGSFPAAPPPSTSEVEGLRESLKAKNDEITRLTDEVRQLREASGEGDKPAAPSSAAIPRLSLSAISESPTSEKCSPTSPNPKAPSRKQPLTSRPQTTAPLSGRKSSTSTLTPSLTPRMEKTPLSARGSRGSLPGRQDTSADTQRQLAAKETEIEDLQQRLEEAEAAKKETETQMRAVVLENEDLQKERQELEKKVVSLKVDLEESQNEEGVAQEMRNRQKEKLEKALQEIEELKASRKKDIAAAREEVQKVERSRIQAAAMQLRNELATQNQKKLQKQEATLKEAFAKERAALEEKLRKLSAEKEALQNDLNRTVAHHAQQEATEAASERKLSDAKDTFNKLSEQAREQHLQEMEDANVVIEKQKGEIAELKLAALQREQFFQPILEEHTALQKELRDLKAVLQDDNLSAKMKDMEAAHKAALEEAKLEAAAKQQAAVEAVRKEAKIRQQAAVDALRKDMLERHQQEIIELKDEAKLSFELLEADKKELEEKLLQIQPTALGAERQLKDLEEASKKSERHIADLEAAQRDSERMLATLKADKEDMEKKLVQEIEEAAEMIAKTQQEASEAQEEAKKAQQAAAAAQEEAKKLASLIAESKEEAARFRGEAEAARKQVEELEAALQATKAEAKKESDKVKGDLQRQCMELQTINDVLNKEVNELKKGTAAVKAEQSATTEKLQAALTAEERSRAELGRTTVALAEAEAALKETKKLKDEAETMAEKCKAELVEVHSAHSKTAAENDRKLAELKEALRELKQQHKEAVAKQEEYQAMYKAEHKERRKVYNRLQEKIGAIRVLCRVRPVLSSEQVYGEGASFNPVFPSECEIVIREPCEGANGAYQNFHKFEFDRVLPPTATQVDVFNEVSPLVVSALDGYHICLFAYGQTASGKTHTMEGPSLDGTADESSRGISQRTIVDIFEEAKERTGKKWTYTVSVSVLEIYNEKLYDLLSDGDPRAKVLSIRQSPKGGTHVPDARSLEASSAQQVLDILMRGQRNRSVGVTDANERSSRSHCILTITVEGSNPQLQLSSNGRLHLIDLAGSERVAKSGAQGERLKEGVSINQSLSALGDTIAALVKKDSHVPFRNSQLTYFLQDSLSGDGKVLMIVSVSPCLRDVQETLNSLNFARRVQEVELGKARKHTARMKLPAPDGTSDAALRSESPASVTSSASPSSRSGTRASPIAGGSAGTRATPPPRLTSKTTISSTTGKAKATPRGTTQKPNT